MEKKRIEFNWKKVEKIPQGKNIIYEDHSIVFEPQLDVGPFGLYLYDWTFEIPTGTIGKNQLRYLGGYFFPKACKKKRKINIPNSIKGIVTISSNFELGDGVYYNEINSQFITESYFDEESNWLWIGDISAQGRAIEIASNNIIIVNSQKELIAVCAKLFY